VSKVASSTAASFSVRTVDACTSSTAPSLRSRKVLCRAESTATAQPTPVVKIDNIHDAFATVVTVEFGDQLGEMLETITALKNLGLNIRRAKLQQKTNATSQNTFYITEATTSEKIVKSARLEEIRMTVLNSLLDKVADAGYAAKPANVESDNAKPLGSRAVVQTTIDVVEADNGSCSILKIKTRDRAGLLVDIVRVLKDVNLNVVSAEVDTVGAEAQDEFFVTYRGEPLSPPMVTLVTNALQYYLSLSEVAKEESY